MKVVLLQDVAKLGKRHSVVDVADGYALNVLIPKKQASIATKGTLSTIHTKEEAKKSRDTEKSSLFERLATLSTESPFKVEGKKHDNGHLFAALSKKDIHDAIVKSADVTVSLDDITIPMPIKTKGTHKAHLSMNGKEYALTIVVV